MIRSVQQLHNGLTNLLRLFREARKYKDLELCSQEHTLVLPLPDLPTFTTWVLSHTRPMMDSLSIRGINADSTKTIRADFLLGEFPFSVKDVGVGRLRKVLDRIHSVHIKDPIGIATTFGPESNTVYLPREMEITLVYNEGLTSDAMNFLDKFKKTHRRITIVELSLRKHLRCYLLSQESMPRNLRRLGREETKQHTPKPPIQLNELPDDSVEVLLVGGIPGDVIESVLALPHGVNLTQYWKICHRPRK